MIPRIVFVLLLILISSIITFQIFDNREMLKKPMREQVSPEYVAVIYNGMNKEVVVGRTHFFFVNYSSENQNALTSAIVKSPVVFFVNVDVKNFSYFDDKIYIFDNASYNGNYFYDIVKTISIHDSISIADRVVNVDGNVAILQCNGSLPVAFYKNEVVGCGFDNFLFINIEPTLENLMSLS